MPQFIVTAYDYTDAEALARRMKVRDAHTALITKLRGEGKVLCGLAMMEGDKMVGSTVICNMERAEVDAWLKEEPYMTGKVWERVDVKPAKLGPSFADMLAA